MLAEVSIAWIEAGCSLKKEPAGENVKVKNIEAFLADNGYTMSVKYGTAEATHRYYLLTSGDRKILFGYDAVNHQPSPVFKAEIN